MILGHKRVLKPSSYQLSSLPLLYSRFLPHRGAGKAAGPTQRIFTKFKPENSSTPNDVPSYSMFPLTFLLKIIAAKVATLLHL